MLTAVVIAGGASFNGAGSSGATTGTVAADDVEAEATHFSPCAGTGFADASFGVALLRDRGAQRNESSQRATLPLGLHQ